MLFASKLSRRGHQENHSVINTDVRRLGAGSTIGVEMLAWPCANCRTRYDYHFHKPLKITEQWTRAPPVLKRISIPASSNLGTVSTALVMAFHFGQK